MTDTIEEQDEGLCMDDFQWDDDVRYRFENTEDGSFKFYEITLSEADNGEWTVTTAYGSMRPGAHITRKVANWPSKRSAQRSVDSNIQKRIQHGYREV